MTYLNATRQSARGMLTTFERFQNDQIFLSQRVDPYVLSHPMATERIALLSELAHKSPYFNAVDPPALQARHDMMRAKLVGFTQQPEAVARIYPSSNASLPARYARAISAYRFGSIPDALRQIDALIAEQPSNAYFYEIKGQALLEAGRAREAVAPLRRAVALSNGHPLIRMLLGQALVATDDKSTAEEAVRELNFSLQREPDLARRLALSGHGLWPQGRHPQCRPRLGAIRFPRRRLPALPRAGDPRQERLQARLARLAEGRRHRQFQAAAGAAQEAAGSLEMTPRHAPFPLETAMPTFLRAGRRALAAVIAAGLVLGAAIAPAAALDDAQRKEFEGVIKDYLLKNPEVIQEAIMELQKRQAAAEASQRQQALTELKPLVFDPRAAPWSAIPRATSRWSSSSTTIAATAKRRSATSSSW